MNLRRLITRRRPMTERTTATIAVNDRLFVVDVCNDGPTANPWYVSVDELEADGSLADLAAAHCEGARDQCNGDTLLAYWTDEVIAGNV
jgi:hypothetical protein